MKSVGRRVAVYARVCRSARLREREVGEREVSEVKVPF